MKALARPLSNALLFWAAILSTLNLNAQPILQLELRPEGGSWRITWPASWLDSKGAPQFPTFELQRSEDLKAWTGQGTLLRAATGAADERLAARLVADSTTAAMDAQLPGSDSAVNTLIASIYL